MTIRSRFEYFESAIDSHYLQERFERELKRFRGDNFSISNLYVSRVFPRKDLGFTIQYEIYWRDAGDEFDKKMFLCGHLIGPSAALPDYIEKAKDECIVFEDIGLVVPVFPFDPRLHNLAELTDTRKDSKITDKLSYTLGTLIEIRDLEVIGYRLGKRLVLRYLLYSKKGPHRETEMIAKMYRPSRFIKALDIMEFLLKNGFGPDEGDSLTVPCVLGSDPDLAAIFMEHAPGMSLHSLIEKVIFTDACAAAGRTLRKLHSTRSVNRETYSRVDELGNLQRILELIIYMYPEFGDDFKNRFRDLTDEQPSDHQPDVLSHRDFFDKQVLFSEDRTTLLDCDNAAPADPALDIGNFVAHLTLRKMQHPHLSANIDKGIELFINSYDITEKQLRSRVLWWTRVAQLRIAILYFLRPRWRDMIPGFLSGSFGLPKV